MTNTHSDTPAIVPPATQAGEVRSRWAWTEPSVWTDRMLTALEQGVKGGVWYSLIDKVVAPRTLAAAWQYVRANAGAAGVDHVTVSMYERDLDRNLAYLEFQESAGAFSLDGRWIASLNHPSICTLHDVGPNYLVMELVDGEMSSLFPQLTERRVDRYLRGLPRCQAI